MPSISPSDRNLLRDLAKRLAEVAALPIMNERRALWKRHNSLRPVRPMILVFPEGSWTELLPESSLRCETPRGRQIEQSLRLRLYYHDHFQDDTVIEGDWAVSKVLKATGWGMQAKHVPSGAARGSYGFDPVIKTAADLKSLTAPTVQYDPDATQRQLAEAQELFGDILKVRLRGVCHISYHCMGTYIHLRGLEQIMEDMTENPGMLHQAMSIFEAGYKSMTRQYVEQNLLDLNNDNTYHNSGGVGWTDELPAPGFDPARVRLCDMWGSAEAQEMAQVGPEMHEEFILQYEKRLLEPFGLTGYGCCEDLTLKLDRVFQIPHIRRISISPWADVDRCAAKLGGRYIFSWKPNPTHLVGDFDEDFIRRYIRHTLDVARENGCVLEMILKDTHTCENQPDRFDRWTRIARELVENG